MSLRLLVFVSSSCPHCPVAARVARKVSEEYLEYGLSYEKMRIRTSQGKELADKYYIRSVPTLLFLDSEGNELNRAVGAPSEESLRKKIETLLGLRKSFMDKLFKK